MYIRLHWFVNGTLYLEQFASKDFELFMFTAFIVDESNNNKQ